MEEIATIVKPETMLAWHVYSLPGCFTVLKAELTPAPRTETELERLIVRMVQENHSWGYDRIVGALANLGYQISDNTVGNILIGVRSVNTSSITIGSGTTKEKTMYCCSLS